MNKLLNRFCNLLMRSGNTSQAQQIVFQGFALFLRTCNLKGKVPEDVLNHNPMKPLQSKSWVFPQKQKTIRNVEIRKKIQKVSDSTVLNGVFFSKTIHAKTKNVIPENMLHQLVENIRPYIQVRKVRIARVTHLVPAPISKSKGQTLALRWIIEFAKKRKQRSSVSLARALAQELYFAHKKQGGAHQRRNELHRLAEANRSYMRYRWW